MERPLLVFDLDGTLVDSAPDLIGTLQAILPRHGFSPDDDPQTLRDGIGHGARHLIEYALHRRQIVVDEAKLEAMHTDFLEYYEANICVFTRPFPGLVGLLERFAASGWMFGVCTNKLEGLSRLVVESLGLGSHFTVVCGGDTFATRKPDPGHLLGTVAAAGGTPQKTIMVGDSRTDLDTARSASIAFVGVSFGYTPVPMAELGPDILIDHFDEFSPKVADSLLSSDAATTARARAALS